mgnify:CR=1 FL=1
MILFFTTPQKSVIATQVDHELSHNEVEELCWLYGGATLNEANELKGWFVGPRREMITPWSTNAVEITQNMNLRGIARIEEYFPVKNEEADHDPMLQRMYNGLDQEIFTVNIEPAPIEYISDLETYNEQEGLALSPAEIEYLHGVEKQLGRQLTDSEVFGFAQINSEHCRHKIFGGSFIIDGKEMPSSLFAMIKKTTQENPHKIISAYKDNVAFAQGPVVEQFAPADHSTSDWFRVKDIESVISIKAETHNFPTTVEPFNGASTGTGGEIRDRMGGGVGSWPIAGTAVYPSGADCQRRNEMDWRRTCDDHAGRACKAGGDTFYRVVPEQGYRQDKIGTARNTSSGGHSGGVRRADNEAAESVYGNNSMRHNSIDDAGGWHEMEILHRSCRRRRPGNSCDTRYEKRPLVQQAYKFHRSVC